MAAHESPRTTKLYDRTKELVRNRYPFRSSAMPAGEDLDRLAGTGATLAIHLSITNLARVVRALVPLQNAARTTPAKAAEIRRVITKDLTTERTSAAKAGDLLGSSFGTTEVVAFPVSDASFKQQLAASTRRIPFPEQRRLSTLVLLPTAGRQSAHRRASLQASGPPGPPLRDCPAG